MLFFFLTINHVKICLIIYGILKYFLILSIYRQKLRYCLTKLSQVLELANLIIA